MASKSASGQLNGSQHATQSRGHGFHLVTWDVINQSHQSPPEGGLGNISADHYAWHYASRPHSTPNASLWRSAEKIMNAKTPKLAIPGRFQLFNKLDHC